MKKIISAFILCMFALSFLTCTKVDKDPNDRLTITQLDSKPSATPTPTTPSSTTVTLAFWTTASSLANCGYGIYVYVDGQYLGNLQYSNSSTPACTSSTVLKKTLTTGSHTYYAMSSNGIYTWGTSASNGLPITVGSSAC